jgi:hypothetical protein
MFLWGSLPIFHIKLTKKLPLITLKIAINDMPGSMEDQPFWDWLALISTGGDFGTVK